MAKFITRYFESAEDANKTRTELLRARRLPPRIVSVYDKADELGALMDAAPVAKGTVDAYKKRLAKGGAVMAVRAGYQPLGVARIAREVMAEMGAVDMGDVVEEVYVKDEPKRGADKILADHPRFLSRYRDPESKTYQHGGFSDPADQHAQTVGLIRLPPACPDGGLADWADRAREGALWQVPL